MSMTMTNAFAMSTGSDSDETPKPAVVVASAQGNTVTSSAFDTDKKWVNTYEYELTINPLNNPKVVVGGVARYVALDYFRFNWNGDDPAAQTIFSGRSAILNCICFKALNSVLANLFVCSFNISNKPSSDISHICFILVFDTNL